MKLSCRSRSTGTACSFGQPLSVRPVVPAAPQLRRRVALPVRALLDPTDAAGLLDHAANLVQHVPLAYEPVAAPCSLMNCGDVVHRSTLDPVLRKEVHGLDWRVFPAAAAVLFYMFATPGVLPGAIDYYVLAELQRRKATPISK
eukprot:gene983-1310_t